MKPIYNDPIFMHIKDCLFNITHNVDQSRLLTEKTILYLPIQMIRQSDASPLIMCK